MHSIRKIRNSISSSIPSRKNILSDKSVREGETFFQFVLCEVCDHCPLNVVVPAINAYLRTSGTPTFPFCLTIMALSSVASEDWIVMEKSFSQVAAGLIFKLVASATIAACASLIFTSEAASHLELRSSRVLLSGTMCTSSANYEFFKRPVSRNSSVFFTIPHPQRFCDEWYQFRKRILLQDVLWLAELCGYYHVCGRLLDWCLSPDIGATFCETRWTRYVDNMPAFEHFDHTGLTFHFKSTHSNRSSIEYFQLNNMWLLDNCLENHISYGKLLNITTNKIWPFVFIYMDVISITAPCGQFQRYDCRKVPRADSNNLQHMGSERNNILITSLQNPNVINCSVYATSSVSCPATAVASTFKAFRAQSCSSSPVTSAATQSFTCTDSCNVLQLSTACTCFQITAFLMFFSFLLLHISSWQPSTKQALDSMRRASTQLLQNP